MYIKQVRALTDEHPRNCSAVECFSAIRTVVEELDTVTARLTKMERAVSFSQSELDNIHKAFFTMSQNGVNEVAIPRTEMPSMNTHGQGNKTAADARAPLFNVSTMCRLLVASKEDNHFSAP